jgi:N-acetylmuramoyl-L-alanine amidase
MRLKTILVTLWSLWLLTVICLPADALFQIPVHYNNLTDTDFIALTEIESRPYFNILELNKTLNAFITEDLIDRRIFVDLYDQRMIFLLDSSYVIFNSDIYSFFFETIVHEGKTYLPLTFLQYALPAMFPEKINFDHDVESLQVESPVDNSFRTVVIDPGHGGKDPGALGFSKGVYEKDVVLSVSKKVKKLVEENLDVQVLLTRDEDVFVPLQQRTAFANRNNANLFISLHCNAAPNRRAEGIEVFFLSAARSDEARAVELMENSVVEKYEGGVEAVKRYDDLTFILMDMAQAEQLRESSYLAIKLQANLVKKTSAQDRGVKQAGFYVLRGAFMPSALVELGFISNQQEERKLVRASHQQLLAEAIYEGIKSYIYNYEMFR